jgi:SAM-dependent methyltransferase
MGPPAAAVSPRLRGGQAIRATLVRCRHVGRLYQLVEQSRFGQHLERMDAKTLLRSKVKAARRRGASWVRLLDVARLVPTAEGRAQLWTRIVHGVELHQTTPHTEEERYPVLFDMVAKLAPGAHRILSFGCSTGEELVALRRRFGNAVIVGAEINPRSRRIAKRRVARDSHATVQRPHAIAGKFDIVFALAVFQREPHKVVEIDLQDLSSHYPFERFDRALSSLVARLRPGGLLCVAHALYPVEVGSAADALESISISPVMEGPLFGSDGKRIERPDARTIFRKRSSKPA